MKNAQILIGLAALYFVLKSAAPKTTPNTSVATGSLTDATRSDLQQSDKLLQDRINRLESRLSVIESSPYQ